jgi:hypothetical protein
VNLYTRRRLTPGALGIGAPGTDAPGIGALGTSSVEPITNLPVFLLCQQTALDPFAQQLCNSVVHTDTAMIFIFTSASN